MIRQKKYEDVEVEDVEIHEDDDDIFDDDDDEEFFDEEWDQITLLVKSLYWMTKQKQTSQYVLLR
jgi:hypothetical protein